jgi:type IV pilus assembly protein PilW
MNNTLLPIPVLCLQRSHKKTRGFTLVELMVAIALGVGIIAGLMVFMANNSATSRTTERASEIQINGRYALNSIRQELLHAGNRAFTVEEPNTPGNLGIITTECLEAGAAKESFITNMRQGIWGSNNANPFVALDGNPSCIPDSDYAAGEDILVIRRVADVATTSANLQSVTVYFASSYNVGEVFRGNNTPTFAPIPSLLQNFAVQIYVYYVSPYTSSSDESPRVPALKRIALRADGSMTSELVASGIEHFQVEYAQHDTAGNVRYYDTISGSSSNTAPSSLWNSVRSVRIWLLARNATPEPGYSNTNTYAMGDTNYVAADNFRRQMFSTVVQLRNNEP